MSEQMNLSYSYLSRLETNSAMPSPETVAKIAELLHGDLKELLELADCLPRVILDRITADQSSPSPALRRAAGPVEDAGDPRVLTMTVAQLADEGLLPHDDALAVAQTVALLCQLPKQQRDAFMGLIQTMYHGDTTAHG